MPQSKSSSFTKHLRRAIGIHVPLFRFLPTTWSAGGSGTLYSCIWFERPIVEIRPRFRERIGFDQNTRDKNFKVVTVLRVLGPAKGDSEKKYNLQEGELSQELTFLSPVESIKSHSAKFEISPNLDDWLAKNLTLIDTSATKFLQPCYEVYDRVDRLCSQLMKLYTEWYVSRPDHLKKDFPWFLAYIEKQQGHKLSDIEIHNKFPYPYRSLDDERFRNFKEMLISHGFSTDYERRLSSGFWHYGRPMREEDFSKDYYSRSEYCLLCGEWKTRGSFVEKKDSIFGTYIDFVCLSCSKKKL